jgi:hypothetical protein
MKASRVLLAVVVLATVVTNTHAAPPSSIFVLAVPELKLEVGQDGTAVMPHSFVSRLELRVLRSSQEIPAGKILVRINGEAANIIMTTHSAESTIVCDLNLYFRPGFLLHAGRNSVEATVESIYGRVYYGTFLLDVADQPASLREIQVETTANKPGENPPVIQLIDPQGPVESSGEFALEGYVDGGVAPITVAIQGSPIQLSARALSSGARGLKLASSGTQFSFSTLVKVAKNQDSVEVTATDANNNRTRLLIPIIQGTRKASERYAVIIGVSHYRDPKISSLQFADRDAEAVRDFLIDPKGGGVPPENLRYLVNEEATYANIRSALFDFLAKPRPDDLAYVYFAGHGASDSPKRPDNYYLLGYDTDLQNIGGTAVPMWDLQVAFERTLQSNLVNLVDACHSGAIGKVVPNMTNQRWINLGYGKHRAIITASDIREFSSEGEQWGGGHGVFTYFLLRGLKGEADKNHDHQITVGEVFDFVSRHVNEETGGAQKPYAQAGMARGLMLTQNTAKTAVHRRDRTQLASGGRHYVQIDR